MTSARSTPATVIRLDEHRPADTEAAAWGNAARLLQLAQARPSMDNMIAAVDAWRAWERLAGVSGT